MTEIAGIQNSRISQTTSNRNSPPCPTQAITTSVDGVNIDLMEFFELDAKTMGDGARRKLTDIQNMLQAKDSGDMFNKLSKIMRKISAPNFHETRYGKVWQYLKVQKRISELEAHREALTV